MISKKTALLGEVMLCLFLCSLVKQYGYRLHGKKNVHVNSKFCKSVLSVPNSPFLIFIFSCLHFFSGLTQLQLKGKLFFMEATSELLKIHIFWETFQLKVKEWSHKISKAGKLPSSYHCGEDICDGYTKQIQDPSFPHPAQSNEPRSSKRWPEWFSEVEFSLVEVWFTFYHIFNCLEREDEK